MRKSAGVAGGFLLSGCLGGENGSEEGEVGEEPYGRFRVIRDSENKEVTITVLDPMTADHAAIAGDHNLEHDIVMKDIEENSTLTLSARDGVIKEKGELEVFAIRGDFETQELEGYTAIDEVPENYRSIEDDDNPFSYNFS
jgi:hypothetical protein